MKYLLFLVTRLNANSFRVTNVKQFAIVFFEQTFHLQLTYSPLNFTETSKKRMLRQILVRVEDQRVPFSRYSLVHDVPIWRLTELHHKTLSGRQEFFWGARDRSPLSRVSRESPRSTSGGPVAVPLRPPPRFSKSVSLQKVTDLGSILHQASFLIS